MRTFIRHRDEYLAVLMILKGRGDHIPATCTFCPPDREQAEPTFRCIDCNHGPLMCQECCVEKHQLNPLHRIQHWTGQRFQKVSLRQLGFVVQLGHQDGSTCLSPVNGPSKFVVIHDNGIHRVRLQYCGCRASVSSQTGMLHFKWEQLMRNRWFPA
ncbi:hypothetical protein K435DRAFT_692763, partial [Dendrothele bispora CBS 962.96]